MRITLQQASFSTALGAVCKGIAKDNTNPVFGGVLLETDEGAIRLTSMNSVRSVRYVASAMVEEGGAVVLPGVLLAKMVTKMPDRPVTLTTEGTVAVVRCGKMRVRLNTLDAERFGGFPEVDATKSVVIPTGLFASMSSRACKCVLKDQIGHPELMGVHVCASDGVLRMSSTDTYRMFEAKADIGECDFDAIADVASMSDMASMVSSDDVEMGVSENQVKMTSGCVSYVGRALGGRFIDISALSPKGHETVATVDSREMADALARISEIAKANGKVILSIDGDVATLTASSPDSGEAVEEVEIDSDGDPVTIGLSHQYLMDGFRLMGETTEMWFNGPKNPVLMMSSDDCDMRYLLMPTRL